MTSVTLAEDATYTLTLADIGVAGPVNPLWSVQFLLIPLSGTFMMDGSAIAINQIILMTEIEAGRITWTPDRDECNVTRSIQMLVQTSTMFPSDINIDVNPVPDAPNGNAQDQNTVEDIVFSIDATMFGFSDNPTESDTFASVIIASPAEFGTLLYKGIAVSAGQEISFTSLGDHDLTYLSPRDGTGAAHFQFQLRDSASIIDGGENLDQSPDLFTINIIALNDAPTSQPIADQKVAMTNTAFAFALPTTTFSDADANDTLTLSASLASGAALPGWLQFDPATQTFTGTPMAALTNVFDIVVTATDSANASVSTAFTLTIIGVNSPPSGSDLIRTISEDTTYRMQVPDFAIVDPDNDGISTVTITALSGRGVFLLGSVPVTIGQVITAAQFTDVSFVTGKNEVGSQYGSIGFRITDNGPQGAGGNNVSATENHVTFNVVDVVDTVRGNAKANRLTGTEGADVLLGFGGKDKLNGSDGDDTLTGGRNADHFIFNADQGHDVITDFSLSRRAGHDMIDIRSLNSIASFQDLKANHMTMVNGDAVIVADGMVITIEDIDMKMLAAQDFLI